MWLTFAHVPESRDEKGTGPLDWTGSALAAVSLGAAHLRLNCAVRRKWRWPAALVGLALGSAGLVAFWFAERRAKNPILPAVLFRTRPFVVINVVTLFLYGALSAVMFLLPFDLIARRGMAASAVGMTMIPFGLIIGFLSRRAGRLADRYGARNLLVGGSLVVGLGAAWIALSLTNFWIGVFVPLVVMAFGMAAVVTPLTTVVMNSAPDAQAGAASGINNAASRVAGLVAVAVLGTIAGLLFRWTDATPGARFGVLPPAGDASRATLDQAFVVAYSSTMGIAAVWCWLAAATAFFWLTKQDCMASEENAEASAA